MKKIGIYKITSPSGRIYIGQSINIERRRIGYSKGQNLKGQPILLNSIEKYGWIEHIFEIIEECDVLLLNERERYWQDFYNSLTPNGMNCLLTSSITQSGKMSEEIKDKIRKAQTGKILSQETKDKIREGNKGKHSNIVGYWKGKKRKPRSYENRKGENHHNYGKPAYNKGRKHSPEARQRMSEAAKRRNKS